MSDQNTPEPEETEAAEVEAHADQPQVGDSAISCLVH